VLSTRRDICVDFIFCKLTLLVLSHLSTENQLSESVCNELEELAFGYWNRSSQKSKDDVEQVFLQIDDLFAEIIGKLSHSRLETIAARFYQEIDAVNSGKSMNIAATMAFCRGVRFLKLDHSTSASLEQALKFVGHMSQYLSQKKVALDLKVALCELLGSVIASMIDNMEDTSAEFTPEWYKAIEDLYATTLYFTKKSKAFHATYPLQTALLCLSSETLFSKSTQPFMDTLFKCLKPGDKLRTVALESIYRLLLSVFARKTSGKQLEDAFCSRVASEIFPAGKKAFTPQEESVDVFVDIISLISIHKLEFVTKQIVLQLLSGDSMLPERVMIGLLAFVSISERLDLNDTSFGLAAAALEASDDAHRRSNPRLAASASSSQVATVRQSGRTSSRSAAEVSFRKATLHRKSRVASMVTREDSVKGELLGGVSQSLDTLFKQLDSQYGNLLLTNQHKTLVELVPAAKLYQLDTLVLAVECLSRTFPARMPPSEVISLLCKYSIHMYEKLRLAAVSLLRELLVGRVALRGLIINQFCQFLFSIGDSYSAMFRESVDFLLSLMQTWNSTASAEVITGPASRMPGKLLPQEVEACAIMLLCNPDVQMRQLGLNLLDFLNSVAESLTKDYIEGSPVLLNVIKESGSLLAQQAFLDPFDMGAAGQPPPIIPEAQSRVCFLSQLLAEQQDLLLWSRLLGALCREVLRRNQRTGAAIHLSLVPRVDLLRSIAESTKVETIEQTTLWRNYTTCAVATLDLNHAPAGSEVAGACLRAVLPLLRSEISVHRELLQRALCFVPPPYIEKLFEGLQPYDADAAKSRKTGNKKEALRIELLRVYASCACSLKYGFEEREQVLKKFVQVIKDTNAYLVSNESVPGLYSLKHSLFLIVKNVIEWVSDHSPYKRDTFFPISLRSQLFAFIAQFSGSGLSAAPVQKREQQDLDDALSKLKTPEERDQLRQSRLDACRASEFAGIDAMCALLTGPAFDPAVFDGDGPVFRFLTEVFRSKAAHIRQLGARGLTVFLESTAQRPAAFHQCVDLSYVTEKVVADACFLNMSRFLTRSVSLGEDEDADDSAALIASASAADHAPPYTLSTMLTLVMYKCGDPEEAIRDAAVQLLRFLCTRFALQGTQTLSRFSGLLDVADAFTLQQHNLSEQLSIALPDLTKEVFDEVLSRLATIQPTAQKRLVALLTPWVGNFNLTSMEKDEARLVLAKLCVLTLKHPNEPHLADHLWTRLVSSHPTNIGVAFDFVFELAVKTQNTRALPMVKKVCLYLSRAAPEIAIARLAAELESSRDVYAPDPSRADARAQVSNPLSWQLEDMIPPHPFQFWFSRGDVALAALSSVVAEHPAHLVPYLPSFLFAAMLAADHPNEAVYTEVRSLIYNLVHSTLTHLNADRDPVSATARARLYAVVRLHGDEDQNNNNPPLWERDMVQSDQHTLPSARKLIKACRLVREALSPHCPGLVAGWSARALLQVKLTVEKKFAQLCLSGASPHSACRALQMYRALQPDVSPSDLHGLVHALQQAMLKFNSADVSEMELGPLPTSTSAGSLPTSAAEAAGSMTARTLASTPPTARHTLSGSSTARSSLGSLPAAAANSAVLSASSSASAISSAASSSTAASSSASSSSLSSSPSSSSASSLSSRTRTPTVSSPIMMRRLELGLGTAALTLELLSTLREMVQWSSPEKLRELPHLFWASLALLRSDRPGYCRVGLELVHQLLLRIDFSHADTQAMYLRSLPRGAHQWEPAFVGAQILVLKGLAEERTEPAAAALLGLFASMRFGQVIDLDPDRRLLGNLLGLLPRLCHRMGKGETAEMARSLSVAFRESGLDSLAEPLAKYAELGFPTVAAFARQITFEVAQEFFPLYELFTMRLLTELLDRGPVIYRPALLLLLDGFLRCVDCTAGPTCTEGMAILGTITRLLEEPDLWQAALGALEVVVARCPSPSSMQVGHAKHMNVVQRLDAFTSAPSTWRRTPTSPTACPDALGRVAEACSAQFTIDASGAAGAPSAVWATASVAPPSQARSQASIQRALTLPAPIDPASIPAPITGGRAATSAPDAFILPAPTRGPPPALTDL